MEHVSLLDITIRSEDLAISKACSDDTLIHTNQASASIDRWGHGDQYSYFRSCKSCNKTSIDFKRNTDNEIPMKPPRTIGIITSQITSLGSGTGIGRNSGDVIPPRNIGSFSIFDRETSYLYDRISPWNGATKSE